MRPVPVFWGIVIPLASYELNVFSQRLDREQWKPVGVAPTFQKIVDDFIENGRLQFYNKESDNSSTTPEPPSLSTESTNSNVEFLMVGEEKFVVVG